MNRLNIFGLEQQEEDKNLLNYYWFENFFSKQECESIIELAKSFNKQEASILGGDKPGDTRQQEDYRKSTLRWIPLLPTTEFVFDKIAHCVKEANEKQFKLSLTGFSEDIQFTEYESEGAHYDWHVDIGQTKFKRKLSVVTQLSDPNDYVGGELLINLGGRGGTPIGKQQGSVILFPSFLLHKVTKIESGVRYSLVNWISGPPWT